MDKDKVKEIASKGGQASHRSSNHGNDQDNDQDSNDKNKK